MMLLGAVLSDTVILNSPTTTERDHAVVDYLERVLALDATELGREMFEATSDVSEVSAEEIVTRDAKRYQVRGGQTICIAQVEVVGNGLLERKDELLEAMRASASAKGLQLYALMVTDVLAKGTELLVAGDARPVAPGFGAEAEDGDDRAARRHEPQEGSRAEAAGGALSARPIAAQTVGARSTAAPAPRPTAARAGSTRACRA